MGWVPPFSIWRGHRVIEGEYVGRRRNTVSINRRTEGGKVSRGEPESRCINRGEIGTENKKHEKRGEGNKE